VVRTVRKVQGRYEKSMVRIVHGTKSPQMVRNVYGTKSLAFIILLTFYAHFYITGNCVF